MADDGSKKYDNPTYSAPANFPFSPPMSAEKQIQIHTALTEMGASEEEVEAIFIHGGVSNSNPADVVANYLTGRPSSAASSVTQGSQTRRRDAATAFSSAPSDLNSSKGSECDTADAAGMETPSPLTLARATNTVTKHSAAAPEVTETAASSNVHPADQGHGNETAADANVLLTALASPVSQSSPVSNSSLNSESRRTLKPLPPFYIGQQRTGGSLSCATTTDGIPNRASKNSKTNEIRPLPRGVFPGTGFVANGGTDGGTDAVATVMDICGNTPRDVTPRDVTPRDVTPRDVTPRDVTPRDVTPRDVTPRDVTPRAMSCTPRTPGTPMDCNSGRAHSPTASQMSNESGHTRCVGGGVDSVQRLPTGHTFHPRRPVQRSSTAMSMSSDVHRIVNPMGLGTAPIQQQPSSTQAPTAAVPKATSSATRGSNKNLASRCSRSSSSMGSYASMEMNQDKDMENVTGVKRELTPRSAWHNPFNATSGAGASASAGTGGGGGGVGVGDDTFGDCASGDESPVRKPRLLQQTNRAGTEMNLLAGTSLLQTVGSGRDAHVLSSANCSLVHPDDREDTGMSCGGATPRDGFSGKSPQQPGRPHALFVVGGANEFYRLAGVTGHTIDPHAAHETQTGAAVVWRPQTKMSSRRQSPIAAWISGRLIVAGGFDGMLSLKSCESCDVRGYESGDKREWESRADMCSRRQGACGGMLADDALWVCGGHTGETVTRSCERMCPSTGVWTEVCGLPEARFNAASTPLADGRLAIVGGFNGKDRLATCCGFDPRSKSAVPLPALESSRFGAAMGRLGEHTLVVAGGYDGAGYIDSALSLDTRMNSSWTSLSAKLSDARGHCAGAVANGRFYVIGGSNLGGWSASVESIDLATVLAAGNSDSNGSCLVRGFTLECGLSAPRSSSAAVCWPL